MSNVIEVLNLSRHFEAKAALDNVSLHLPRGQVLGLIGENGSGKTTLIKHVLGLLKAQKGIVRVLGFDPVTEPVGVLENTGYLAEEDLLPGWMRVYELERYYQGFYPNWDSRYAEELRTLFAIDRKARIKELSKGQRARVGLLAALSYRPQLLLLDEPSSGLDPVVRRDILGSVIRAVADDNRTVLFSSHLLSEIEQVADQVAMIQSGKILFQDSLDDVKAAHARVSLRFSKPRESAPAIEDTFCWEGMGAEWTCLCSGKIASLEAAATLVGAKVLDQSWLTLDEIFIARSGRSEPCSR